MARLPYSKLRQPEADEKRLRRSLIVNAIRRSFGKEGVHAYESVCVTDDDIEKGFDYVVSVIAPGLEEEFLASGREFF